MERIFDEELKALKGRILALGGLVEEQVQRSIKALVDRDSDLARTTIEEDHRVNRMEVEVDEECVRLIALRQPAAGDLRFLTTAMKIVTDLERMGDLAVDTCERALELNEEPPLKPYIDIPRMADAAQRMLKEALDAFVNRDAALARKVCRDDDFVDDLNKQVFRELVSFMVEDPHTITRAIRISFISKYLERVADHATNIAEMVVYMVEGRIIRHMVP
ncbi:MAG: phosphate transport system regulatory protein PhoU [Nitrospirae bacterium RBG_16_64_22]|nr:MAG: phosphate transport system regulatory protein PhoU [Nitrospirae bacterium RBG_16_64_22]